MANSSEDSLNTPNPNPNCNPTSDVGSGQLTMQQHIAILRELVQTLVQKSSEETKNLSLPRFNPGIAGSDPAACCAVVNLILEENPLRGSALFFALEGSATQWLSQVPVAQDVTWSKFKVIFIARFGGKETATSVLMKMSNEKPLKDETTGAFGIRIRSFLKAKWENLTLVEVINASVVFQLASLDQRIERIALQAISRLKINS